MRNHSFKRWMGPFVGATAGAIVGIQSHGIDEELSLWGLAAGGATLGLIAGTLISLAEPPPQSIRSDSDAGAPSGTLFGRLFALLSLLLVWAPIIGFLLAGIAAFLNRRVPGWPRKVSRVTIVVSALISIAFIVMVEMSSPNP